MTTLPAYRALINVYTTKDREEYVLARIERIRQNRKKKNKKGRYPNTQFGDDLLNWWFKLGAPVINEDDTVIPVPKFKDIPEKYAGIKRSKKEWGKPL